MRKGSKKKYQSSRRFPLSPEVEEELEELAQMRGYRERERKAEIAAAQEEYVLQQFRSQERYERELRYWREWTALKQKLGWI
jgi:hypothetical protein